MLALEFTFVEYIKHPLVPANTNKPTKPASEKHGKGEDFETLNPILPCLPFPGGDGHSSLLPWVMQSPG